jgi:hypothetical protein
MKKETTYLLGLTLLYFVVSLIGILHHELWLDESHHWLLARDSVSFLDLIKNTRYEGHPILWNVLLFWISRITLDPFWMQMLHIIISTSAVAYFLLKAPFNLALKTLFIFGYFIVFEYNLISRNYIIGVLFLFISCAFFRERKDRFILWCTFLALATNVHLMFAVIAFALFLTVLVEKIVAKNSFTKTDLIGCAIFFLGVFLLAIQVIPPEDTSFFHRVQEIPLGEKFTKGFIALFKGLITIPDFRTIHFWNSNLLVNFNKPISAILGLLVYFIPLLLFRKRLTLFFVYIALFGAQIFFFVLQLGSTRYDGMTFLIIITGLWIDDYFTETVRLKGFFEPIVPMFRKPLIYILFIIQFCSGVCAWIFDYKYPFTTARDIVGYLKEQQLDPADIVTITCDGTLISPYLEKKVWFLCEQSEQSYCHWDRVCAYDIEKTTITTMLSDYMKNHNYAVYVSYYAITDQNPKDWTDVNGEFKIRFHKRSGESIVRNNSIYIYEVAKTDRK